MKRKSLCLLCVLCLVAFLAVACRSASDITRPPAPGDAPASLMFTQLITTTIIPREIPPLELAALAENAIVTETAVISGPLISWYQIDAVTGGVIFSPDGLTVAFSPSDYLTPTVYLIDGATGDVKFELEGAPAATVFSPDGRAILTTDGRLWDVATGTPVRTLGAGAGSFSPDGSTAVTSDGASVRVWDVSSGEARFTLEQPPAPTIPNTSIVVPQPRIHAIIPNSNLVVTFDDFGPVRFWNLTTGTEVFTATGNWAEISPDQRTFVVFGAEQTAPRIGLYESATGALITEMTGEWPVYSPDGNLIAISHDGVVDVWETQTGQKRRSLPGSIVISGDLEYPAWLFLDRKLFWAESASKDSRRIFSPDSRYLVTVQDAKVYLWDLAGDNSIASFLGNEAHFSPDGQRLAVFTDMPGNPPTTATAIWKLDNLAAPERTFDHPVQFTAIGLLAYSLDNLAITLWNLETGEQVGSFQLIDVPREKNCYIRFRITFSKQGTEAYITAEVTMCLFSGSGSDPYSPIRLSLAKKIGVVRGADR